MTRQAAAYRAGRVLLAGDAAHVHYPVGGQGLSLGVQDAVNLGWKLAQVVDGTSPESLLDTYQAERHPVAARALKYTMALGALQRRTSASRLSSTGVRAREHGRASQTARRRSLGAGHPLRPRRGTSAARTTDARSRPRDRRGPAPSLRAPARRAGPCCSTSVRPASLDITPWADRVQLIDAEYAGPWELPRTWRGQPLPPPSLLRPDGYVAWVGDGTNVGLPDALATWFGPPAAA